MRNKVFSLIEAEYARSVKMILTVTQRAGLLENQPTLAQSIRRRNPYVDPLSLLQIRFLSIWRGTHGKRRSERLRRLLALTVSGIASGMKSTG